MSTLLKIRNYSTFASFLRDIPVYYLGFLDLYGTGFVYSRFLVSSEAVVLGNGGGYRLVVWVYLASLDLLYDAGSQVTEYLFNLIPLLGGGLVKLKSILLGVSLTLLIWDLSSTLSNIVLSIKIRFIAYEHYLHFLMRVRLHLMQPLIDILKAIPPGNIVHHQRSNGSLVVRPSNRLERLLSSSIPYLYFDYLIRHLNVFGSKLYPQCRFMLSFVPPLSKPQ